MWWLAETVSNCLSTPVCQSCPSLIPPPHASSSSSLVLLLQLLIIFSLNCRGQTTFSDGVVTLLLLLGKIFYLGKNTASWHVFLLFGRERNERGTLVLSFVLWYFYRFKTMSFSCHNSLKSKQTWTRHYENTDEIQSKRMDTCTYSLMYTLKMKTIDWNSKADSNKSMKLKFPWVLFLCLKII